VFYNPGMPIYRFKIRSGRNKDRPGHDTDLPDNRAAWKEAAATCRDLSRDIIDDFAVNPVWELEVADTAGTPLFRFRFVAENLE
jgi:hypothetical protein